ncbi:MAG: hypothetical protein E7166_01220 [Firmicutes bacterium]|nr:hypothetical protein [Bacillota bacterium]
MYNEENKRLNQIDLSIIGVIIFICILIHSIYLLLVEKKKILKIETISDENLLIQSLINRIIAFFVVLLFFSFSFSNYNDILKTNNEEQINNQSLRLLVSTFALLSVTTEVYLTIKQFISLKESEQN